MREAVPWGATSEGKALPAELLRTNGQQEMLREEMAPRALVRTRRLPFRRAKRMARCRASLPVAAAPGYPTHLGEERSSQIPDGYLLCTCPFDRERAGSAFSFGDSERITMRIMRH